MTSTPPPSDKKQESIDPAKIPLSVILRSLTTPQWVTIISLCAGLLYGAYFLSGQIQSSKMSAQISSLRDSLGKMKAAHEAQLKQLRDSVKTPGMSDLNAGNNAETVFAIRFGETYSDKAAAASFAAQLRTSAYQSLQRIEVYARNVAGVLTYSVVQLFDNEKERDQKLNYYEMDYPKDADNQQPKCGVPKSLSLTGDFQHVVFTKK